MKAKHYKKKDTAVKKQASQNKRKYIHEMKILQTALKVKQRAVIKTEHGLIQR